jgi:hypothetical protein
MFYEKVGLYNLYYFGIVLKVQQDEISKVRLGYYRTLLKKSKFGKCGNGKILISSTIFGLPLNQYINKIGRLMMVSGIDAQ